MIPIRTSVSDAAWRRGLTVAWLVEAGLRNERSRTYDIDNREAAEGSVLTVGRSGVQDQRREGRGQTVVKNTTFVFELN